MFTYGARTQYTTQSNTALKTIKIPRASPLANPALTHPRPPSTDKGSALDRPGQPLHLRPNVLPFLCLPFFLGKSCRTWGICIFPLTFRLNYVTRDIFTITYRKCVRRAYETSNLSSGSSFLLRFSEKRLERFSLNLCYM